MGISLEKAIEGYKRAEESLETTKNQDGRDALLWLKEFFLAIIRAYTRRNTVH